MCCVCVCVGLWGKDEEVVLVVVVLVGERGWVGAVVVWVVCAVVCVCVWFGAVRLDCNTLVG